MIFNDMTEQQNRAVPVPSDAQMHRTKADALAGMFAANVATWMVKNRMHYPHMLFWAGAVAVGIVIGTLALSVVSRAASMLALDLLEQLTYCILFVAFAVTLLTMTAGTVRAANESIFQPGTPAAKALPETTWQAPNIGPDILVCLLPGETLPTFAERANAIRNSKDIAPERWAVVLFPNSAEGMILTDGDPYVFTRGNEPFLEQPEDWAGKVDHIREEPDAYRRYVTWFCDRYVRWVTAEKINLDRKSAIRILTANMAAKAATAQNQ